MSLKVWLPLNGNLNNNGVSPSVIVNSGATVNSAGKIGSCYSFDGNDDYISITDSALYSIFKGGTQPFSIAMWVYHADTSRAILFGDYGLSGSVSFNVELYTDHKVRFYWNANPDYNTTVNVGASTWTHVAITYDGSALRSYANGDLINTRSGVLAALSKTSGGFYLGRDSRTGATALNGRLNDFRIYDHCLSTAEVHEIAQGLVCHYKLDYDYSDNIVTDSSGYGYNGTATGTISQVSNSPRYDTGNHLSQVKINSTTGFPSGLNPNFTVSFWAKIYSNVSYAMYGDLCGFYDKGQGNNTFRLELCGSVAGDNLMWFRGPSGQSAGGFPMNSSSSSGWFTKDVWHHVALVGNGQTKHYYCYFDGIQCQDYNGSANSWEPTGQFYIDDTAQATADFSDFRIYATALSAADIKALYETDIRVASKNDIHAYEFKEAGSRELIGGAMLTTSFDNKTSMYTGYTNGEIALNGHTSVGSEYIDVYPSNKTYRWDAVITKDASNTFYLGFERYDASKTSRSNNACVYVINDSTAWTRKHVFGTVDLSTDGTNPCRYIALRILNDWSSSPQNRTATVHSLSLREVTTVQTPTIQNNGVFLLDELKEESDAKFYKNGFVESSNFTET